MKYPIQAFAALAFAMIVTMSARATTSERLSITVTNVLFASSAVVLFVLDGKVTCKVITDKLDDEKSCAFSIDCSAYTKQQCIKTAIKHGRHFVKADFGDFSITRAVDISVGKATGASGNKMPDCVAGERMGSSRYFFECQ